LGAAAATATKGLAALAAIELAEFATDAVKVFANFDRTIRSAAAVMAESTGDMVGNFNALELAARQLAVTTVFTATEIGEAFFFLGQAGLSLEESLIAVDSVLDIAQIGMIGLGQAADIVTDIMASMGIAAEEVAGVTDILTKTFTDANTSISALGTAFSKIGPLAANLGIDITEVSAAIGVLSSAGIKGEEAGTAVRNIFLRLLNPSRDAQAVLDKVGLTASDVASGMFSLEQILVILKDALDDGTIAINEISEIFQARATPAVLALANSLDDGTDGFAAFVDKLEEAGGTAEDVTDFINESAAFAFDRWRAAVENLKIELGEALVPIVIQFIEMIRENQDTIITFIEVIARLVISLEALIPVIDALLIGIIEMFTLMDDLGIIQGFVDVLIRLAEVITDLGPTLPIVLIALLAWISPLFAIILVIGFFSDEILLLIDGIEALVRGIITAIDWVISLGDIVVAAVDKIASFVRGIINLGLWMIVAIKILGAVQGFQALVGWLDLAFHTIQGVIASIILLGQLIKDEFLESEVGKLLAGFLNLVGDALDWINENLDKIERRVDRVTAAIETGVQVVSDLSGTSPSEAGFQRGLSARVKQTGAFIGPLHAGEAVEITNPLLGQTPNRAEGPAIGTVNNVFNVANPDPLLMEQATRKYLRRLRHR
jgi:TP901 family phage tail tape measure protein